MYEIPELKNVKLALEQKRFYDKFMFLLEQSEKKKNKVIQFDFDNYIFKEEIIRDLFSKGYEVQHMKYKEMYAIYLHN